MSSESSRNVCRCVLIDVLTRVLGALGLWPIEIIMQLRIYALFNRANTVAVLNAVLFVASIVSFCAILVHNAKELADKISFAKALPISSCPIVHVELEWVQWVPRQYTRTIDPLNPIHCYRISDSV